MSNNNYIVRGQEYARRGVRDGGARAVNFFDPEAEPMDVGDMASLKRSQTTFVEPDLNQPRNLNPAARTVTFMPSQVGKPDQSSVSYTATPLKLLWYDIQLVLGKMPSMMGIMKPWRMGNDADPFDEMYPSGRNLLSIALHLFLLVTQFVSSISFTVATSSMLIGTPRSLS